MTLDRATRREFRQRMRRMLVIEMKIRARAFAGQLEDLVSHSDAVSARSQTLTVRKARWGVETDPRMGTIACADVARAIAMETVHTQHGEFAHFQDGAWLKLEPGGRCRRAKAPKERHIIGRLPCEGITGSGDARRWANSVHAKREIAWSEELEETPARGETLAQWIERKDLRGTFVPGAASGEWMGEENPTIGTIATAEVARAIAVKEHKTPEGTGWTERFLPSKGRSHQCFDLIDGSRICLNRAGAVVQAHAST